LRAN
jgi:hypothetical protein